MTELAQPAWRVMYDSADPARIPADAEMVAGYVYPSRYAIAWQGPSGFDRFPGRPHVRISVAGTEPDGRLASVWVAATRTANGCLLSSARTPTWSS